MRQALPGRSIRAIFRLWMIFAALAAPLGTGLAPVAWAQDGGTVSGSSVDNSAEYAMDPSLPSREPSTSSRLLASAAVVGAAFVVGAIAAGSATGGLFAAGAAALLYATMP